MGLVFLRCLAAHCAQPRSSWECAKPSALKKSSDALAGAEELNQLGMPEKKAAATPAMALSKPHVDHMYITPKPQ